MCMHMLTIPVAYSAAQDFRSGQVNIFPPFLPTCQSILAGMSAICLDSPGWDTHSFLDLKRTKIFHLSSSIGPLNASELRDHTILAFCIVGIIVF